MAQAPDRIPEPPPAASPFWRKPLSSLTKPEWESLCDGCGRCCLVKLEDEDDGRIHFTDVACKLLDCGSCRCSDYDHRQTHVPDCVKLTPELVETINWLPPTCGYRLVAEGRDLLWWHPLVSGTQDTVHEAGISVRNRKVVSEESVEIEDLPHHIVSWPTRWPKRGRKLPAGRTGEPFPRSGPQAPAGQDAGDPGALRSEPKSLSQRPAGG